MSIRLIMVLLTLISSIFLTTLEANSMQNKPLTAGTHTLETTMDGKTIRYTLVVPKLSADKKYPLILALHYGGTVTPYYSKEFIDSLVIPAFQQLPAFILAPDCPGEDWRDPLSEKAVLMLLDKSLKDLPVDAQKVVVTGYSRGGIGTWFMATRHPERFSAAIPVSARPKDEPDGKIPFYVIHSSEDELFPLDITQEAVKKLQAKPGKVELHIVHGMTHYETGKFAQPLSQSVEWLNKLWSK